MRAVPGATVVEQAVALAGALAELGVQEVIILKNGVGTCHRARMTDLPGALLSAGAGARLRCEALGLEVRIADSGLSWTAGEGEARLVEALARSG